MPEENDVHDAEPNCETEPESKPTITIAERQGDEPAADAKPTITIAEREDGDIGVLTSPDDWLNPWDVKKNK